MSWLDKLLGRDEKVDGLHDGEATSAEHERHVEQSAHPGTAPVVPPDTSGVPADEIEETRDDRADETTGEEKLEETRHRDDQEGRFTREQPRPY